MQLPQLPAWAELVGIVYIIPLTDATLNNTTIVLHFRACAWQEAHPGDGRQRQRQRRLSNAKKD